jgi:hypothetical protein
VSTEDQLDTALDNDLAAFSAPPELRELIDTGAEVGGALSAWRLDSGARSRIYARAVADAGSPALGPRLRALGLDRRVQAIAGGAVVTIAAATAVAVARGRRHAAAGALGA